MDYISAILSNTDVQGVLKILGITACIVLLVPMAYLFEQWVLVSKIKAKSARDEQDIRDLTEKKLMDQGIVPTWRADV